MNEVMGKQEVATVEKPLPPATDIIQVIERAACNPLVDIEKMQALLQMKRDVMADEARRVYTQALSAMQPKLPVIKKRGKIDFGQGKPQKYPKWEDVMQVIGPVLAANGFALTFRTGSDGNDIVVTCVLSHEQGHEERTSLPLPVDNSGSKNPVQGRGSTVSYGKRYTASALLNLVYEDEDNDGQDARDAEKITDDQVNELLDLITETDADLGKVLKYFKADSLESVAASKFSRGRDMLASRKPKQ